MNRLVLAAVLAVLAAPIPALAGAVKRDVYILKASGVCPGCPENVAAMLKTAGIKTRIIAPEQLKDKVRPPDAVIIPGGIPGGEGEWTIKQHLVKAGAFQWLKQHIAKGGLYVGICAGAYLAEEWIDRENDERGLDLFPGKIDVYSQDRSARLMLTKWEARTNPRWMYFQNGPAFFPRMGADIQVLATFAENGTPAAVIFPYGKGKAALISPHPEADATWYAEDNLDDPDGVDADLGSYFVQQALE